MRIRKFVSLNCLKLSKLWSVLLSIYFRTFYSEPAFRIAAEIERKKWKQFRSLLDNQDRKMFDAMFSYVRIHNSDCMLAARPVVVHSVLMSILFEHYKILRTM